VWSLYAPSVRAIAVAVLVATAAHARAAPTLGSHSAIVLQSGSRDELLATNADEIRPIASLTKLFVALVLRRHHLVLDSWSEITAADAAVADGGAAPRLRRGESFRNIDLLHAMLLVSENRVPTALARSVGLTPEQLVAELNALAGELGLAHTKFIDPTGIAGNQSTARELAIALDTALHDPLLARIMRTKRARFASRSDHQTIELTSTVRPLWERFRIRGGKTGHTDEAGYCMIVGADVAQRSVVMVFLGAPTSSARYGDFVRVAEWLARRLTGGPER